MLLGPLKVLAILSIIFAMADREVDPVKNDFSFINKLYSASIYIVCENGTTSKF